MHPSQNGKKEEKKKQNKKVDESNKLMQNKQVSKKE